MEDILTASEANKLYAEVSGKPPYRDPSSLFERMKKHGYTLMQVHGRYAARREDVVAMAQTPSMKGKSLKTTPFNNNLPLEKRAPLPPAPSRDIRGIARARVIEKWREAGVTDAERWFEELLG